jgi:sarcosine oxidase/L-pipecolate oxidase
LPVIGKYAVGSLERKLPNDLLEKWKFPTQFRNGFQEEIFTGDGSRGGPERREMTSHERDSYSSAGRATVARQSKI